LGAEAGAGDDAAEREVTGQIAVGVDRHEEPHEEHERVAAMGTDVPEVVRRQVAAKVRQGKR
jgi:hypothetical protein